MAKVRCKENTLDSFYGSFLYEQVIPKAHFLVKLKEVIDWQRFTKKLLKYYQGKGEIGQAPYEPAAILKMLLISFLYNISERQTEQLVDENLPAKFFVGLGVNEKAPDHSTLSLFKNRLLQNGGRKAYEGLFDEIIKIALEKGIKFGQLQVIDSVHIIADVNVNKDKARQKEGSKPRDRDATWGAKGNKVVVNRDGKKERKPEYFYGYKDQVSLNAETEIITSIKPGYANGYDGRHLPDLVENDLEKGIEVKVVAGDKGYDDGGNHYFLNQKGINSAIRLNDYRTKKKNRNKQGWAEIKDSQEYKEGLRERYKIERKFAEVKKWHGFSRCRYIGFLKHAIQCYLTFMAVNLKRLVKLLTGVSFRGGAKAYGMAG